MAICPRLLCGREGTLAVGSPDSDHRHAREHDPRLGFVRKHLGVLHNGLAISGRRNAIAERSYGIAIVIEGSAAARLSVFIALLCASEWERSLIVMCIICINHTHVLAAMRTNVVIDDALMDDVLKATGLKTKREAVELGLKTLLRLHKQEEIKSFRGKLKWEGDLEAMRTDA